MTAELALLKSAEFNGVTLDCYVESDNVQERSSDFWATREQIGRLLEYKNPRKAIKDIHLRNKERLDRFSLVVELATPTRGAQNDTPLKNVQEVTIYNFKGLLEICRYSNQPKANAVIDFLWDVADEIRRTGSYNASPEMISLSEMRIRTQERANEIEAAKLLQHMAENPSYGLSEKDKRKLTQKIAMLLGGIEVCAEIKPEFVRRPKTRSKSSRALSNCPVDEKWRKGWAERGWI